MAEPPNSKPAIDTAVEVTLPDGSNVQGVVIRKTHDLHWVCDAGGQIHEDIKRSDLRIVHRRG